MKIQARITSVTPSGKGAHIYYVIEKTDIPRSKLGRFIFRTEFYTKKLKSDSLYTSEMKDLESRMKGALEGFLVTYCTPDADVNHLVGKTWSAILLEKANGLSEVAISDSKSV